MASRFWVGGSGNTSDAANHWSATSGGAPGAAAPTTADDIVFDTLSHTASFTFTVDATLSCKSFLVGNPLTGSPTWAGSSPFTMTGAGTAFQLVSGMTRTFTGAITFNGTGSNTLTLNTVTMASSTTFSGTGTYTMQDTYNNGGSNMTHTNGTVDTNGQTVSCAAFQSTGTNTRTLTLGATVLTCSGAFTYSGSGLTLNENTSSIRITASSTFAGNGETFNDFQYTAVVTGSITGANTFATCSITGTSTKTCQVSFGADQVFTTSLTVTGNSTTARMYLKSDVKGTARTLTSASNTMLRVDCQDITGAGAGSWNLSAITGLSGDCGGNSGITFTTGVQQFWNGAGSNWSTAARWFLATAGGGGAGRVPLPQDDARFDSGSITSGSQTVTHDMPRSGKNIDWSGVTNTPTYSFSSTAKSTFGSLTLVSGMAISGTLVATFEGRGAFTITSAGLTFGHTIVIDSLSGSMTQQDAFVTTNSLSITSGTWSTGTNFNCTANTLASLGTVTRTLNINNSTVTLNGTGSVLNLVNTGFTLTKGGTSTVVVNDATATAKTVATSTNSLDILTISGDNVTKSGSSTVGTLNVNTAGLTTGFIMTAGDTVTVTTFATNGSAGNLAKLLSSSAGSAATLSKSSGTVSVDYMSIKDSTATGGASWYAGANSTNVSGNTGWTFTAPPAGGTFPNQALIY